MLALQESPAQRCAGFLGEMKIIIEIIDNDTKDCMLGVPMDDLKTHFLPQIGIKASKVTVTTEDEVNIEDAINGHQQKYYKRVSS